VGRKLFSALVGEQAGRQIGEASGGPTGAAIGSVLGAIFSPVVERMAAGVEPVVQNVYAHWMNSVGKAIESGDGAALMSRLRALRSLPHAADILRSSTAVRAGLLAARPLPSILQGAPYAPGSSPGTP
ncbi:MAG TPA: hypothetical protein VMU89_25405, partial [Thermomicrobiaceae bacterium]|nr:hypothetical protein [Thermomicrobiaceae bacterium]